MFSSKQYTVQLQGNNIVTAVGGRISATTGKQYHQELTQLVAELGGKPFGYLADIRKFAGGTPEALTIANKTNLMLYKNGLCAFVLVVEQDIFLKLHQNQLPPPDYIQKMLRIFNDYDEALHWLLKQPHNGS